jgi:hypothetical protein
MPITEPTTMLTDYVLAALCWVLAWRLFALGGKHGRVSTRLWAAALAATGFAALAGGTSHGFALLIGKTTHAALWKATVYAIGLASLFLVAAAAWASLTGYLRRGLRTLAALKFIIYAAWMTSHDEFRYVVYDYVPAMVAVLLLQAWAGYRYHAASAKWIIAGVVVSFLGAGIQQSGFTLDRHFNHNDLYHVIQMGAVVLFYRGGRWLEDR